MIEFDGFLNYNDDRLKIRADLILLPLDFYKIKEGFTMVHIICGEKGKGKTKVILDKANESVKTSGGNVVFLDKDSAHMFELNNKIRLINVKDFGVSNSGEFIGFIYGILSQDHDLEEIFLDSFLKISVTDADTMKPVLDKLIKVADKFNIDIVISLSVKSEDIPEEYRHNVLVSL